jgi:hypothetical protein
MKAGAISALVAGGEFHSACVLRAAPHRAEENSVVPLLGERTHDLHVLLRNAA